MSEKEKYLEWKKDAVENRGLIYEHITINLNELSKVTEEEFYQELNYWNEQLDSGTIVPRIQVVC